MSAGELARRIVCNVSGWPGTLAEWEREQYVRCPAVSSQVDDVAEAIQELVDEAVSAEREECVAKVRKCAENASKKKNLPCRGEVVGALVTAAADISVRFEQEDAIEGGQ